MITKQDAHDYCRSLGLDPFEMVVGVIGEYRFSQVRHQWYFGAWAGM